MELRQGGLKARAVLRLERLLLRYADVVIANSRGAADDLVGAAPNLAPQVTRVIHNPVVWPELAEKAVEPVDHPWFQDSSLPVVLAAGRLVPVKDYPTLLEAFANVVLKVRLARLVVLGEGPERAALRLLVEDLGIEDAVDFPGFVSNPYSYMSRAKLFALSSLYEGSPNVLVQAMACGTPVVSTDCPSGPREILRDGALGRLGPSGRLACTGTGDTRYARQAHRIHTPHRRNQRVHCRRLDPAVLRPGIRTGGYFNKEVRVPSSDESRGLKAAFKSAAKKFARSAFGLDVSRARRNPENPLVSGYGFKWISRFMHFERLLAKVADVDGVIVECGFGSGRSLL